MEVGAILEGNIVDLTPQPQIDFAPAPEPQPVAARRAADDMFGCWAAQTLADQRPDQPEPARPVRPAAHQQAAPAFSARADGGGPRHGSAASCTGS